MFKMNSSYFTTVYLILFDGWQIDRFLKILIHPPIDKKKLNEENNTLITALNIRK
jgi:hypothetical protein